MKIKRTVNGEEMEFELTDREMRDAFYEKQHLWDMEYILDIADIFSKENWLDRMSADPDFRSMVAYKYREYIETLSEQGEADYDCLCEAYRDIEKSGMV